MKYKGLLLDYDGTVAQGSYDGSGIKTVSENVKVALKKLSRGAKVGLCTGRKYFDVDNFVQEVELEGPHICCGGSQLIKRGGEIIWEKLIESEAAKVVFNTFSKKGKVVHIKQGKYQYVEKKYIKKVEAIYGDYLNLKDVGELKDWRVPSMVVVEIDDEDIELLETFDVFIVKHRSSDRVFWQAEVTTRGVSKQKGILEWLKYTGLKREEVVGVGDGYNDYPMLEAVGKPVAMGNAVKELKEAADFVCGDIKDDGVVEVIKKFF